MVPYGGGIAQLPAAPGRRSQHRNANFSKIYYKLHNNWNVCFSCRFDVEDKHTSGTCPFKKRNHQDLYTRNNAQQFIVTGYDPCTKGMHKSVLPSGRRNTGQCGAESLGLANKCKSLISACATPLDPTSKSPPIRTDDNNVTVVASNVSTPQGVAKQARPTMAMAARMLFGSPMPQYPNLNVITIAITQAIANTGVTSIFIMEGVDDDNKRIAENPLTINLPEGKKVLSTHVCDINMVWCTRGWDKKLLNVTFLRVLRCPICKRFKVIIG